ncbi:beta-phosphoglucomutase [Pseudogracilibacillus auburnensis]|uniref:Beta-phosphoglucomutase n=1 Tax=Pseudogracilibacillus auburnensis TaxID=1494959 RepID=A0A2V3VWM5_9BACI|nr:beta-phosphoglucomutase [Pseudogracilibacillus auburnensis]PXW86367.1 beta-phosphoglucomutase [Pseudogracilibacillus auburnensis]
MIKAFIFDLDGVITDTAHLHFKAWKWLASEKFGIVIDENMHEQLKGLSRMDSLEKILAIHHLNQKYTVKEKVELTTTKNLYYRKLISDITPRDILPGIVELLEEIKGSSYKLALASASKNAIAILKSLDLFQSFDFIADAAIVKKGKPAPDIYLLAAKGLSVAPENCIGIEDAVSGIQSIKHAHMFAVGVGDKRLLHEADYVVSKTEALTLPNMMQAWNNSLVKKKTD